VLVALGAEQPAARAQVLDEVGVGVLDEAAGVRADALVVGAVERTGLTTLSPYSAPSRKSSSPNAIAVWTMPVPSSAVTKSPAARCGPRAVVGRGMNGNGGS
jgi:hypothetical protein